MPKAELSLQVKSQVDEIKRMVFSLCELSDAPDGKVAIRAKPGVSREQILHALKCIKKIESIYKERIVDLDELNADIDQQEANVKTTAQMIQNYEKTYGPNIFPKWLLGAYGLK